MQNINKPLLATLALALLSLSAFQASKIFTPFTRVLGDTSPPVPTISKTPIDTNSIPCSVITNLQRQYCASTLSTPAVPTPTSSLRITAAPTKYNYPTPTKYYVTPTKAMPTTSTNCCFEVENNYCLGTVFRYTCKNGDTNVCYGKKTCILNDVKNTPTYSIPKPQIY